MTIAERGTWYRLSRNGVLNERVRGISRADPNIIFVTETVGVPGIFTTPQSTIEDLAPTYTARTPGGSSRLNDVGWVQSSNTAIACGFTGAIETSTDSGQTWSHQSLTTEAFYKLIAHPIDAGSQFIVVGDKEIWGRDNAGVWTIRASTPVNFWRGVAFRASGWVAVADFGFVTTSPTGLAGTWTAPFQLVPGERFTDIRANAVRFMATTQEGSVWTSTTGASGTWTRLAVPGAPYLSSIEQLGIFGHWIAFGIAGNPYLTENDGATWQAIDNAIPSLIDVVRSPLTIYNIAAGNDGRVYVSFDQEQETYVDPITEPVPGPAYLPNPDMAGDAVERLIMQLRSGRG